MFSASATEQQHREREQLLQRLLDVENEGVMPPGIKRVKLENDEGNGLDGWDMSIDTSLNNSLDDMHGAGMYICKLALQFLWFLNDNS